MQRLLTCLLIFFSFPCFAIGNAQLLNISIRPSTQQSVRLVFDLNAPVTHNIFALKTPYRLVVDLKNTQLTKSVKNIYGNQSLIKNVRTAVHDNKNLRVVLDLTASVHSKSFLSKPTFQHGYQLVVEVNASTAALSPPLEVKPEARLSPPSEVKPETKFSSYLPPPPRPKWITSLLPSFIRGQQEETVDNKRKIVIAIDAGHGGIDSGAVGQRGSLEKDVVLALAKELTTLLAQESKISPILIRSGDYFLQLRRRVELAREAQADLFVSLHADAYPEDNRVYGSSVYMLSQGGASNEAAQWLAEKENSADLIGGISLSDKESLLASVLLNLSQAGTLEASARIGDSILNALGRIGKNRYRTVQRASFMVLRSPDVPSVLVETAFISNPEEESRLNDPAYRLQVAQAIREGILNYFANHEPLRNTLLANR